MKEGEFRDKCPVCNGTGEREGGFFCPVCDWAGGEIVYEQGYILNGEWAGAIRQRDRQTATEITLEISSYIGYSFGAQHVYGELQGGFFKLDLKQNVSASEAAKINKFLRREHDDEYYKLYKVEPGDVVRGFLDVEDLVKYATEMAVLIFPQAKVMTIVDHYSNRSGATIELR